MVPRPREFERDDGRATNLILDADVEPPLNHVTTQIHGAGMIWPEPWKSNAALESVRRINYQRMLKTNLTGVLVQGVCSTKIFLFLYLKLNKGLRVLKGK